jgi:hypothetical protein
MSRLCWSASNVSEGRSFCKSWALNSFHYRPGCRRTLTFRDRKLSFESHRLLQTIQNDTTNLHEILKALRSDTCKMMQQLDELKFERRPKDLGYAWETDCPKDCILVDDGLDPPFPLPMSLCSSSRVRRLYFR